MGEDDYYELMDNLGFDDTEAFEDYLAGDGYLPGAGFIRQVHDYGDEADEEENGFEDDIEANDFGDDDIQFMRENGLGGII